MSHHGMSMGSMTALPALETWPTFYWAAVGSAIGVATVVNIYNYSLYRQRLSAARAWTQTPAKPQSWLPSWTATLYAFTREASNFSIHVPLKGRILRMPTVGRTTLIVLNIIVLVVLCLYGLELNNVFTRESVGFRCGVITLSQLPLVFMLSGKNNIIGYFSGISYERLNWLHRWCARCMLLTATMHMGYFISAWAPFDYVGYQLKNNAIVWKGLASWCTLVWIVFSSVAPIRTWCYELFIVQHIISFALFLYFIYIHTPVTMHIYVWISVGLFAFDRVFRFLRTIYANVSAFHPSLNKQRQGRSFLTCQAEFTPLPQNITHVVIRNPPIGWSPGQHVFLSCQSVAPLQNHPFTIASIPEDGRMDFFIKAEKGGTRQFFRHAEKMIGVSNQSTMRAVTVEGPYGCLRPLRQFDSVILLAGSTGATYTVPLLRDLIQGWKEIDSDFLEKKSSFFRTPRGTAARYIRFVWVIKSRAQLNWFSEQLSSVYTSFQSIQEKLRDIKLELTVYITCENTLTEEHKSVLSSMTSPGSKTASRNDVGHGTVQYRICAQSMDQEDTLDSEKGATEELKTVKSIDANEQQENDGRKRPCCCRETIDETTPSNRKYICGCSSPKASGYMSLPASASSSAPNPPGKQNMPVHPLIKVLSGRPQTKDIIRRSLEQAMGESAVVVCGPDGLVADVKQHVCALSDERAVHKGTGAQGIYLHTESYSY